MGKLDEISLNVEQGLYHYHPNYELAGGHITFLLRIIELQRDALAKCAAPSTWHVPCVTCGPRIIEHGNYIARECIAEVDKLVGGG